MPMLLKDMFPNLAAQIGQAEAEGFSEEEIIAEISGAQRGVREEYGTEAAQRVFTPEIKPQYTTREQSGAALARGLSLGAFGGEIEGPSFSEDPSQFLTNIGGEIVGSTPALMYGLPGMVRALGGRRLAAHPFAQAFLAEGAAPYAGIVAGRTAGHLRERGELPTLGDVASPTEAALFALFGGLAGRRAGRISRTTAAKAATQELPLSSFADDITTAATGKGEKGVPEPTYQAMSPDDLLAGDARFGPGLVEGLAPALGQIGVDLGEAGAKLVQPRAGTRIAAAGDRGVLGVQFPQTDVEVITNPWQARSTAGAGPMPPTGDARMGARIVPSGPEGPGASPTTKKALAALEEAAAEAPTTQAEALGEAAAGESLVRDVKSLSLKDSFGRLRSALADKRREAVAGAVTERLPQVAGGPAGQAKVGKAYEIAYSKEELAEAIAEAQAAGIKFAPLEDILAAKGSLFKPKHAAQLLGGERPPVANPSTLYAEVAPSDLAASAVPSKGKSALRRVAGAKAKPKPTGHKACTSPCVDVPTLNDVERQRMYATLMETTAAEQATRAIITSGMSFLGRLKAGGKAIAQHFQTGTDFTSPSFVLEKFEPGRNIIRAVDEGARMRAVWMTKQMRELYGNLDFKGARTGGKVPFSEGSLEDIAAGVGMENPDLLAKFTPQVRQGAKAGKEMLEARIREYHGLRPDEKIGNIKDYLPHVLDPADLEAGLKADIARLSESTRSIDKARLAQLQETLSNFQKGQMMLFDDVPESLRMRFFETRTGRGGYSFSMVKAVNTYLASMSRKLYMEPAVQRGLKNMLELPMEYRSYAKEYLRDFLGLSQRFRDPSSRLVQSIRELQFVRVMGFNPTSPIRNAFGHMNTLVEIGPKHWSRGVEAALTKFGDDVFEASGHGADIPQIYLNSEIKMAPRWQKFVSYAGWMFNMVERGNRKTAYLGGLSKWYGQNAEKAGMTFEEALKRGAIHAEARQFADDLVRKTQFRYGKVDLPFALRGPVMGTLFQFQSFTIKQAELMWKWATREGLAGKKKLLAYMGVGAGVATMADLIDLPRLGGANTMPQPVDLNEMVRTAYAMTEGDWTQARSAFSSATLGAWRRSFSVKTGPAGSALAEVSDMLAKASEGELTARMVQQFGVRNISPVALRKVQAAVEDLDAGGSVRDFVTSIMGLPTGDAIVRRKYLQLVEQGHMDVARDLLSQYRTARGGHLPLNMATVGKLRRERRLERKAGSRERKKETRRQRVIRKQPREIERQVL